MENDSKLKCSICYKDSHGSTCIQCSEILATIIASLTTKPKTAFSNIENLVFQGGGVKGAAYLGVLEQLESESEAFLTRVKRVAGSSAGSIVALYLALNLDLKDIRRLVVDEKYSTLLDEGLPLMIDEPKTIVRAKTVFLDAIQYFKMLKKQVHDEGESGEALEDIRQIGRDIVSYWMRNHWFLELFTGDKGAEAVTSCILDLLDAGYKIKGTKTNINKQEKEKQAELEQKIKKQLEKGFQDARRNNIALTSEVIQAPIQIRSEQFTIIKQEENVAVFEEHIEKITIENQRVISHQEEYRGKGQQGLVDMLIGVPGWLKEKVLSHFRSGAEIKEEFNLSLFDDRRLLHYSIAELLKQIKIYGDEEIEYDYDKSKILPKEAQEEIVENIEKKRRETKKDPLGVFTGADVKFKLIIEPIAQACKFGHKDYGPTFAELAQGKDDKGRKFKDLYVTAFNTATNRTEIFSVEHTPNVFVAHAVRASMSIPGFFKPVNVAQKNDDGWENRKIYYENKKEITPASEEILFMDGGIILFGFLMTSGICFQILRLLLKTGKQGHIGLVFKILEHSVSNFLIKRLLKDTLNLILGMI